MLAPATYWVCCPGRPTSTHTPTAAMCAARWAPRSTLAAVVLLLLLVVDMGVRRRLCAGCARALACGLPGLLGPGRPRLRAVALAGGVCGLCGVLRGGGGPALVGWSWGRSAVCPR